MDRDELLTEIARLKRVVSATDPQRNVFNGVAYLHPTMRPKVIALKTYLQEAYRARRCATNFALFETYRSPVRQAYLYDQVPRVTKAPPWTSPHQYGLAADFVGMVEGLPSWADELDWMFLKKAAEYHDLTVPISWDRGHVQSKLWKSVGPLLG